MLGLKLNHVSKRGYGMQNFYDLFVGGGCGLVGGCGYGCGCVDWFGISVCYQHYGNTCWDIILNVSGCVKRTLHKERPHKISLLARLFHAPQAMGSWSDSWFLNDFNNPSLTSYVIWWWSSVIRKDSLASHRAGNQRWFLNQVWLAPAKPECLHRRLL